VVQFANHQLERRPIADDGRGEEFGQAGNTPPRKRGMPGVTGLVICSRLPIHSGECLG
jgi:hypothetical protein